MHRYPRLQSPDGFTMIELMIVVAILGILVSVATVSCNHFVMKANAVEGEIVVHEVERLEHLYHASNHAYTDSLADLGFAMIGTLRSYSPEVRIGSATDKINYQVRALPGTASETDAWLLTNYRDGSVQVDRIPVSDVRAFSTVRYLGNAGSISSMEATTIYVGVGCRATTSLNGLIPEVARKGARNVAGWFAINERARSRPEKILSLLRSPPCVLVPLHDHGAHTIAFLKASWRYWELRSLKVSSETADLSRSPLPSATSV